MALKLTYGEHFNCVLHSFLNLIRLKESWDQLWPKTIPEHPETKIIIFSRGLTATKITFRTSSPLSVVLRPHRKLPVDTVQLQGHGASCAYSMLRNNASGPEIWLPGKISAGV